MPLTAPTASVPAAVALVRAGLVDDPDAGVLIIRQNAGSSALVIALAALTVRTLLIANGGDVRAALAVVDAWMRDPAALAVPP